MGCARVLSLLLECNPSGNLVVEPISWLANQPKQESNGIWFGFIKGNA